MGFSLRYSLRSSPDIEFKFSLRSNQGQSTIWREFTLPVENSEEL